MYTGRIGVDASSKEACAGPVCKVIRYLLQPAIQPLAPQAMRTCRAEQRAAPLRTATHQEFANRQLRMVLIHAGLCISRCFGFAFVGQCGCPSLYANC